MSLALGILRRWKIRRQGRNLTSSVRGTTSLGHTCVPPV